MHIYSYRTSIAHHRKQAPADSFEAAEQRKKRGESIKRGLLDDEEQLPNYCIVSSAHSDLVGRDNKFKCKAILLVRSAIVTNYHSYEYEYARTYQRLLLIGINQVMQCRDSDSHQTQHVREQAVGRRLRVPSSVPTTIYNFRQNDRGARGRAERTRLMRQRTNPTARL